MSLIVANLSVVIAFLFRIGTENSATVAPKQLRSRITFGSGPTRKKNIHHDPFQSTTMLSAESPTVHIDDSSAYSKKPSDGNEAEVLTLQTLHHLDLAYDV